MELPWGRRFLMCPPEHFGVLYEINPWMRKEVPVDLDRARDQWGELVATLVEAGAEVELLEPQPGLPDLVFTANAGTLNNGRYVASRFRHPDRQPEVDHDAAWFTEHGFDVVDLPEGTRHEGAGDALPFRGVFLAGYKSRSDAAAHGPLSTLLGAPVRPIELVDGRLYGTLCCASQAPGGVVDDRDLEFLRGVARRVAEQLEDARLRDESSLDLAA